MSSRVLRRRSATAAWIYAAVACGIVGTDRRRARPRARASSACSRPRSSAVGFFQILLDLTVEESLTKYGFRYVAGAGLGASATPLSADARCSSSLGGALATLLLVALAPFADEIFGADGVEQALLAAALLPLVQSSENVGATALLLHSRYDLRGVYQAGSSALRLLAIVIAAPMGVTEALVAIVIAQTISTRRDLRRRRRRAAAVPVGAREGARRGRAADPLVRRSSRASRRASSRSARRSFR